MHANRISLGCGKAVSTLAVTAVLLLLSASAIAGVGLVVTPTFPVSVKIGDTYNLSLSISWKNTAPQNVSPTVVTGINITPSCAQFTDSATCPSGFEDPNVWQLNSPSTSVSGCGAQLSFDIGAQNASSGKAQITNGNAGGLTLPVNGTCVINFTGKVLKLPVDASDFFSGDQTVVLAGATGTVAAALGSGSGSTIVSFPALSTAPGPGGTLGGAPVGLSDTTKILGLMPDVFLNPPFGTVTFRLFAPGDSSCATPVGSQVANLASDCTMNTAAVPTTTTAVVNNGATTIPVVTTAGFKPSGSAIIGGIDAIAWTSVNATSLLGVTGVVNGPYPAGESVVQPPDYEVNCATTTATTGSFTANAAGIWRWTAEYSGDGLNIPLTSGCPDEPVTVSAPTPSIITDQQPKSGTIKVQDLTDFAILLTGSNPTGTITFTLYGPNDPTCSGSEVIFTSAPFPVPGLNIPVGPAVADKSLIVLPGTYHWVASYSGDSNNLPVSSLCQDAPPGEPVVITKPVLTIVKTPGSPTYTPGQTITFSIAVTNTGPGTALNVHFAPADTLPDPNASLNWGVSQQPAQGSCTVTGAIGSQVLNCSFGNMLEAGSATVVVSTATQANDPGDCGNPLVLNNSATVIADNADPKTGAGSQSCTGLPQLDIQKTPDEATINPGDTAQFTIVVSNTGATTATSVTLNDPLPSGGGVNWTTLTADCSVGGAPGTQTLTCSFGDLASGASRTVVVSAVTSLQACTIMPNLATANATNAGSVNDPGRITCLPPPPGEIPTMSEWAMLLMMFLVAGSGFLMLRRRAI